MKIGFLVERNNYFRIFGPVIDRALERGHQVFCLHDYSQPKTGPKYYQFPHINQTPNFQNGQGVSLEFIGQDALFEQIIKNNIQVVVSLDFLEKDQILYEKLKERGIFWTALQCGFDSGPHSGERLFLPDRFFVYSEFWLEWMYFYLKKIGKTNKENFKDFQENLKNIVKPVGFWMVEGFDSLKKDEIKKSWGISEGKKVVLLLPFPFGSSVDKYWTKFVFGMNCPFWQKIILRSLSFIGEISKNDLGRFLQQVKNRQNDICLMKSIRNFCDKNNAVLLVKCRKKDPAKNYLVEVADKVLYDENFYPSTTTQCLRVADLCISFYSMATLEGVACSVPHTCIAPDSRDWQDIQGVLWQTIFEKAKCIYDFPGVSYLRTIYEIINSLPNQTLIDFSFDKGKQVQYLQKFANGNIKTASLNIIIEIEKLEEKR